MSEQTRRFTVEEVNARLGFVTRIVRDILPLARDLHERQARLNEIRCRQNDSDEGRSLYREETVAIESDVRKDQQRLDQFVAELDTVGGILRDGRRGLVDFPSLIDGRDVFLCWELGEEEIGYWHECDTGYAGRQSLLEGSVSNGDDDSNGGGAS